MRRRTISSWIPLAGLIAITVGSHASAWGQEGHQIIGVIAMTRLTPQTRVAIIELLGNDDLATAGLWADQIRGDSKYDWAKPLHYVNAPRNENTIVLERDCAKGECAVGAITRFLAEASDSTKSIEERRDALKFAIHFIGDLHQPLHAGYADDMGGNRIGVIAFGDIKTNLHALWDTVLIRHKIHSKPGGDWRTLANALESEMPPKEVAQWESNLDPLVWGNESLAITRLIYNDLPADAKVGEAYYESNLPTISRRLAAGGVRLAAALNKTFVNHQPVVKPAVKPAVNKENLDVSPVSP
ncbi:MAG: S1/P1 nuclease [Planctomycetota bacterium]|nr:S1/P1 nuclease [Planctomycetota bacterium]